METMFTDVKSKIAKLLALANDGCNDEEAQTALLMARKLMAKYKIEVEDISDSLKKDSVGSLDTEITFSKRRDAWVGRLARVIAKAHRCDMLLSISRGGRTYVVKFVGFHDDLELVKAIFRSAYTYVYKAGSDIWYAYKSQGYPTEYLRSAYDSYGIGFAEGLKEKYVEQNKSDEACTAMMVVTPKDVSEYVKRVATGSRDTSSSYGMSRDAYSKGYEDGKNFSGNTLGVPQLEG